MRTGALVICWFGLALLIRVLDFFRGSTGLARDSDGVSDRLFYKVKVIVIIPWWVQCWMVEGLCMGFLPHVLVC